jgi:hypothetical protein
VHIYAAIEQGSVEINALKLSLRALCLRFEPTHILRLLLTFKDASAAILKPQPGPRRNLVGLRD